MKRKILFVDDEPCVLDSLRRVLRPQGNVWKMTFVDRAEAAWECLLEADFDLVVADVSMPVMNGLQLLRRMQQTEKTGHIPVVMLTGLADARLKRQALDLGAADLLNKPVQTEDLLARLRSLLRLKACQDEICAANALLEDRVQQRTEELCYSRLDMIWRLGQVAEHRDWHVSNHVIRVGCVSRVIAEAMGLSRGFLEDLFLAAPLHDIGKIGISDVLLLKRGPLNAREWAIMKQHCVIGESVLREDSKVKQAFLEWRGARFSGEGEGFANPLLELAASVALSHHEKWDGSGYPRGLRGEEIPMESRIVAIADVFDALTSPRPYRNAHAEKRSLEMVCNGAGRHFDPAVYAAFLQAWPEIQAIRTQFADPPPQAPAAEERWNEESLACR